MRKDIFYINGFWKHDKTKFSGYKVTGEDGETIDIDDDLIFYFGLTEENIKEAIKLKWKTEHDFVITSYRR